MAERVGGFRRKTRQKLRKTVREKGKVSLSNYFQRLEEGDKVILKTEPAVQGGMYFKRFHGKQGVIKEKQGNCYYVQIRDGGIIKKVLVHPIHLKKCQTQK